MSDLRPVLRILGAEVAGRRVDVDWDDGVVLGVHASPSMPPPGAMVVDAEGGALIPGLHDHHLHLNALAAAMASVAVGPADVADADAFATRLAGACRASADGWVRAVGYHESVAGDLDAGVLDDLVPTDVAVRVQHRSGQLWVLNGVAVERTRLDALRHAGVERDRHDRPTGRVFGLDDALRDRLATSSPDVAGALASLADLGLTGVTDLTPIADPTGVELIAAAARSVETPIRVTVTGAPELPDAVAVDLPRGPIKLLPPDHTVIDFDTVLAGVRAAHARDRPAAIHCVTRAGAAVAIAAFTEAGVRPGDRIEHGAVLDDGLLDAVAGLGLLVVTQPNFVAERGDQYLADVEPVDLPHLWRCASLDHRGVAMAGGSDAPYGDPDPWHAIEAAVERRTSSGAVLGASERIHPRRALELFLGHPDAPAAIRRIEAGVRTDLCLLDRPLAVALARPHASHVRATAGRAGLRWTSTNGRGA